MKNNHQELMQLAIDEARRTMNLNFGGPFGALIIDGNGNIIAIASNSVLKDHDPTAHAEMNAIRKAAKRLQTHDLSNCILYTTAYPCPMCLGAIIWANIKKVYYGCEAKDSDEIGFRDDFIYKFIEGKQQDINILDLTQQERNNCLTLFTEYISKNKELY